MNTGSGGGNNDMMIGGGKYDINSEASKGVVAALIKLVETRYLREYARVPKDSENLLSEFKKLYLKHQIFCLNPKF